MTIETIKSQQKQTPANTKTVHSISTERTTTSSSVQKDHGSTPPIQPFNLSEVELIGNSSPKPLNKVQTDGLDFSATLITGMVAGSGFTAASHIPNNLYLWGQSIEGFKPSLKNYASLLNQKFSEGGMTTLYKGGLTRSVQGALTFGAINGFVFLVSSDKHTATQHKDTTKKEPRIDLGKCTTAAAAGSFENVFVRQPFMTTFAALANNVKPNYEAMVRTLPLSTPMRMSYLGLSKLGGELGRVSGQTAGLPEVVSSMLAGGAGALLAIPASAGQEVLTLQLNDGATIQKAMGKAKTASLTATKNPAIWGRELLFLLPLTAGKEVNAVIKPFVLLVLVPAIEVISPKK
jgi:hypothetical protein